jgi:toxin-antitoxin system PIN domain toxin
MRALLDVNVLIALLEADHSLHARATQWFAGHARAGWASCPITQNGCVRIMSHPGYPNALPVRAIMERLAEATTSGLHEFWPDDISLLDQDLVDAARIHGPRQLTDLYLLALAVRHGGRFATFDHSISLEAVRGAKARDMVFL